MYNFPDIEFIKEIPALNSANSNSLPKGPKGMKTMLINKNIIPDNFLKDINNISELELAITRHIDDYLKNSDLERIFHLIQIWGGMTGRGIYVMQQFKWREFEPAYKALIDICSSLKDVNYQSCEKIYDAILDFILNLRRIGYKGLGVSFITKHTRFWMHRNLSDNMIPIYDSTFSKKLTKEGKNATIKHLKSYWNEMIDKSEEVGLGLTSLERQLFNYYQRKNSTKSKSTQQ